MVDGNQRGKLETMELPLRGLASEGAEATVREVLTRVPGVVAVDVVATFRVRITYESRPGTRDAIDAALHALGVGKAHSGPEGKG